MPLQELARFIWQVQHKQQVAANLWTKPISLIYRSAKTGNCSTTVTIII